MKREMRRYYVGKHKSKYKMKKVKVIKGKIKQNI